MQPDSSVLFDERLKNLYDMRWLCTRGVVRINEGTGDRSIGVDNKGCCQRQVELPFAIVFFNVDTEALIDGTQCFRQREDESEFACVVRVGIGENVKLQLVLLGGRQRCVRELGCDGDQSRSRSLDFRKNRLVGPQFQVAVRTPSTPVKRHDDRPTFSQGSEASLFAEMIRQREVFENVPWLRG